MSKSGKITRVDASFKEVAAFWLPDSPENAFGGTLTGSCGKVELLTSPTYEHLTPEQLCESSISWAALPPSGHIEVLHGRTADAYCTLFWLQELERPGVTDYRDGTQLSSIRYRVSALVNGLHLSTAQADEIDEAIFSFSVLHTFYSVPVTLQWADDETRFSYPRRGSDIFSFCCMSLQAEIRFDVVPETKDSHARGLALRSRPRIHIKPVSPRSVVWYDGLRSRLENFFSLILGTSVATKAIHLFQGEQSGFLIKRAPVKREKASYQLRVVCESHILGRALANWLAIPDDEQPVERTFLTVIRKSELFVETEFLSLAQAIEGFGRIRFKDTLIQKAQFQEGLAAARAVMREVWGEHPIVDKASANLAHTNELSFGERIGKIYDMLSADFASVIVEEKESFVRSVVQTRNYFTHPSVKPGASVVQGSTPLFLLNQRLAAFLRCVMLLSLEIPEESLRESITYQAQRWR